MNSFKSGSKEAFLYSIMNDEHKKPNIIRGNSSRLRTGSTPAVKNSHRNPTTPSVSAALKSVDIEGMSCSANNNLMMGNLMIAAADVDVNPVTATSDSSGFETKMDGLNTTERGNMQQQIIDVSDPNVRFFVNEFGEIQVVSSDCEDVKLSEEEMEMSGPTGTDDTELVQASLQTDEGEFMILMKGGEIVAVQHPVKKEEGEIDENSTNHDWNVVCQNDKNTVGIKEESLEISQPTLPMYGANPNSDFVDNSVTSDHEQEIQDHSPTEEDTNQYFVTVHLADGQSILLPVSALENAAAGSDQFILGGNDQFLEVLSSSNSSSTVPGAGASQDKPIKTNKPKKKPPTPRTSSTSNSSSSARISSTKNTVNSVTTSSGFLAPSHQMNAIADAIVNQRNVDSNLPTFPMPPAVVYPSYSRTNYSRVITTPQKELKPKPFRFEMTESDDENMEFQSSTFLPLVIENYQSSFRNQVNKNQSASDCSSDIANIKTEASSIRLSSERSSLEASKINASKSSEQFSNKVPMSPAPTPTQCSKCSFKASGRCSLSQHMTSSHSEELPYKCSQCNRKFLYHYLLLNHMKLHTRTVNVKPPQTCGHCKVEFQTTAELSTHVCELRVVESQSAILTSVIKSDGCKSANTRPKQYPCMENSCYDWFYDEVKAVRHKLEKHSNDFDHEPCQCQFCPSAFKSKADLLKHLSMHEEILTAEKREKGIVQEKPNKDYAGSQVQNDNQGNEAAGDTIQEGKMVDEINITKNSSESPDDSTQKKDITITTSSLQECSAKSVDCLKAQEISHSVSPIEAIEVSKEFFNLFAKLRDETKEKEKLKTKGRDDKGSGGFSFVNYEQPKSDLSVVDSTTKTSPKKTPVKSTPQDNDRSTNELDSKNCSDNGVTNTHLGSLSCTVSNSSPIRKTSPRKSRKVNPKLKTRRTEEDKLVIVSDDEIELIYKPVRQQMLEITEIKSPASSTEPAKSNSKPVTRSQLSKKLVSKNDTVGKRKNVPVSVEPASMKRRC